MRAEESRAIAENLFVGGGQLGALLQAHDWSQTPLGAIETWSDDLKTAVQILLTELDQAQPPEKTQRDAEEQQDSSAEAAKRESEEKYRTLFNSMDEGFCSIEVLYDEDGQPVDHQILEANPAFETHTGLNNAPGRLAILLMPGVEQYWNDLYARVVATGESQRLSQHSPAFDRWFDVEVSRVGDQSPRRVAVVFRDISERQAALRERKRIEAVLQESEEQFRNMADNAPMMIWITDTTGYCTYLSRSWYDFTGQTEETGLGFGWLNVTHPDDRESSQAIFLAANDRARAFQLEYRLRHRDGHYRTCIDAAKPWFGVNGEFKGYIGSVIDIDDRKRAEKISQQAAEVDAFRVSLADALRPLANPVEIQATASRVLGEYLGANRVAYFEVRGADYVVERDYVNGADALAGGYPIDSFGPKLLAAYRSVRTVSVSDVAADPNLSPGQRSAYAAIQIGAYIGIPLIKGGEFIAGLAVHSAESRAWTPDEVSLVEEVAERTWAAVERASVGAALRDSEELKQSILESSKDCIKVLTLNSEIAYINTGGLSLLEVDDPTLVLNACWLDFWQGEDYENAKTAIAAAKAGNTGQFQGYLPTYKGTPKWWDSIITPVRNSAGQVTQLVAVSRDITKQKLAETERERLLAQEQAAREAAETANRVKDEFLAVLSHELRSPLNPILGWTRLLQNGKLDAARQGEALATIERNAKLQTQLISDLLDISRIMRGKLYLSVASVSLTFVISAAVETVRLAAEAKDIQITLDLDTEIAPVSGDAARLQQAVWNLLNNAIKFTPNTGQVTVELRQLDGLAQIQVIDTGKGINPQFLPHVFEYFRQEDGSTTRKFGGLGLGLAIVRQIVEMHGGTVRAESEGEGQGATFIVQLPTMQQTSPIISETIQPQTDAGLPLEGIQILLVDDEPDTREFQAFLLSQSGARVTAVASGLEALQSLEQSIPDVLVSDIGMAGMDGYMLLQQIRSRPSEQGGMIPAIALTAYAAEMDQQQALQVGFQTHITKPVEPEELVRAIAVLLQRGERKKSGEIDGNSAGFLNINHTKNLEI